MHFFSKIIFIFSFTCFFTLGIYSQNLSIPAFRTTDCRKLSEHITKELASDSDKVVAIHKWITHNIKYDVKKWLNFNYDPVPLKKVLKKRKANCLGYSELFNELCKYANLKSVKVTGYVKDINVDSVDNFYLDEHAWNAVLLNNKWKNIDECWDAGYIKYSKVTLFGHIVKALTFGKTIIIKYKPHFVKNPSDNYFLRSGKFFSYDHLSLNPLWQLNSTGFSIKQFKADDAFYFKNIPNNIKNDIYDNANNNERMNYYSSDENYKIIDDGIRGNRFNFRNHYCLARAYYAIAENEISKFDLNSINKVEQNELYDTVISCVQKSLIEYDTNASYLRKQKNELLTNSIIKKNTVIRQNNNLIRATKNIYRNLSNGKKLAKKNIKLAKKLTKTYESKYKKLEKNKSFFKTKLAKSPTPIDSLKYYYDALFTSDSIAWQQDSINIFFTNGDKSHKIISKNINEYAIGSELYTNIETTLKATRFEYYDDLDHEIRMLKDTVLAHKYMNDANLFIDSTFFFKALYKDLKLIKNKIYRQSFLFKNKAAYLTKLKASCINEGNLKEEYEQNLLVLKKNIETFSTQMEDWISRYNEFKRFCRKQKSLTKAELISYINEKATEYGFYTVRNKYIKHHFSALISNNKYHVKKTMELKRKAESHKKKLEKIK
ncbi:MAG TPA: transglutaminase domain-containing protein [Bacteroidales bacterium]|nr:transglutaminase domain-containing protein [Bacteroidales bacterium]HPS16314.1 transglutaminase domain-containing protein [Bacteroidales bacterium]